MEFLNDLENNFWIVIIFLLGLLALLVMLFYDNTKKESVEKVFSTLPLDFLESFFELKKKKVKKRKDKIEKEKDKYIHNRMCLLLLMNKDEINLKKLNEVYESEIKSEIREPLTIYIIQEIILGNCKFVSTKLYKIFYNSLNEGQLMELGKAERFLYKIGINVKSDYNFYKELAPLLDKMTLKELFDKITKIKKVTGKNYKKAYCLLKTRRAEYIRGILDFGFSEDQMDSIERMREINAQKNKKNKSSTYTQSKYNHELGLGNLANQHQNFDSETIKKENKKVIDDISNEFKNKNTSQKKRDKVATIKDSTFFKLSSSDSSNIKEFTNKTLRNIKGTTVRATDNNKKIKENPLVLTKGKNFSNKNSSNR